MIKMKSTSKFKRKTPKRSKVKKKIKSIKKMVLKKIEEKELILKTKPEWVKSALVNKSKYQKKYSDSIKNNNDFWKREGKRITWIKPYKKIKDVRYSKKEVKIKWYEDGTLNASANCIDRHLKDKKTKQQLFGWVMIQKILKKFHTNNYIIRFLKLQMV